MEIDTNMNLGSLNGATAAKRSASSTAPAAQSDSFATSTDLEGALQSLPSSRPEAVERAKALIAKADYPSDDTVQKLSKFLANQLQSSFE